MVPDQVSRLGQEVRILQQNLGLDLLDDAPRLPKPNLAARAAAGWRAGWDRYMNFTIVPCAATPAILLGILSSLAGVALFGASLVGINLKEVEKILGNVSLSFMLSLIMIRTGLHAINTGVKLSDDQKRTYNETVKQYYTLLIKMRDQGLKGDALIKEIIEVKRMDMRLDFGMRIFGDTKIQELIKNGAISIYKPQKLGDEHFHSKRANNWYGFWHKHLPKVGKADVVLGVIMFAIALLGIALILKEDWVPPGLDLSKEDPYLSTSFVLVLFIHSATCIHSGSQMINYTNREERRSALIDRLRQRATGEAGDIPQIEMASNNYTKLGKLITNSKISLTIMTIVSLSLVALGIFYMISTQEKIPPSLAPITINETINLPFATGIILSGFYGIHRVSSFSEKELKEKWKQKAEGVSKEEVTPSKYRSLPQRLLWLPHLVGGVALFVWGSMILHALNGKIEIPDELKPGQSSYSVVFASALLVMALDTFNTGYRMATYQGRKEDDGQFVELLTRQERRGAL